MEPPKRPGSDPFGFSFRLGKKKKGPPNVTQQLVDIGRRRWDRQDVIEALRSSENNTAKALEALCPESGEENTCYWGDVLPKVPNEVVNLDRSAKVDLRPSKSVDKLWSLTGTSYAGPPSLVPNVVLRQSPRSRILCIHNEVSKQVLENLFQESRGFRKVWTGIGEHEHAYVEFGDELQSCLAIEEILREKSQIELDVSYASRREIEDIKAIHKSYLENLMKHIIQTEQVSEFEDCEQHIEKMLTYSWNNDEDLILRKFFEHFKLEKASQMGNNQGSNGSSSSQGIAGGLPDGGKSSRKRRWDEIGEVKQEENVKSGSESFTQ